MGVRLTSCRRARCKSSGAMGVEPVGVGVVMGEVEGGVGSCDGCGWRGRWRRVKG